MEIAELKQRLPLAQVLQHYGLKPDKHLRLHCPFHDDSTPSLQVYYKTHTAYCFSSNCKTHGKSLDVIDFVMYMENTGKHEAIEKCKTLVNGTANKTLSAEQLTRVAVLTRMFTYFKNGVYNSRPAKEYISHRGLDHTQVEIGFNTGQFHHGSRKEEALIQSCIGVGLLSLHDRAGRTGEASYRPFAKNCIVFALRNGGNQVSGLYFRSTINDSDARHFYLKDRQGLYPRYPAADTQRLIITESIIDAATLLQIPAITAQYRVLALYGTNGLTDEHITAIQNLPQLTEIILWLDGDEAGEKATAKHAQTLQELLPSVTITQVYTPAGEDINSLGQTHSDTQIFTDLLAARTAPGSGARLFVSTEIIPPAPIANNPALLKNKTGGAPPGAAPAVPPVSELDTVNPFKIRYSGAAAHYYVQGGITKASDHLKIMLVIESQASGVKARNKIDLYEDKQVEKLCKEVSEKLCLRKDLLEADLYRLTDLLEQHREREQSAQAGDTHAPPVLTIKERQEVEQFAKQPHLIKRLNELLGQAGIIGEERNRIFLLLIAASHKMPETLHALIQGSSGSGKTRLLKQITDCMPPESVTRLTRLSDKVLYNYPENYFVHRLLCLEDMDGLSEEAEFALRELQSNGELNSATSIKLDNGQITSGQKTVRGPIASMSCTTHGEIYEDNMGRVFLIAVDESSEQTGRIIAYQNQRAARETDNRKEQELKTFLQNLIRLLQPYEVVNPYAAQIQLPPQAHKIRRLNELFQGFVKMVTLFNQYQRRKDERGRLIAQSEDLATAIHIMFESIVLKVDELDGSLRRFYEQLKHFIQSKGKQYQFTRFEVKAATGVGKTQQHHYMNRLVQLEYIQQSGFANRGFTYTIVHWDNHSALRDSIKQHLNQQLEAITTERQRTPGRTPASATVKA